MNPHWHDLAAEWQDVYKLVNRVPADPREILHGLKAVQDDAFQCRNPESTIRFLQKFDKPA